ncbi:MAG: SLOG family protein [Candidatus Merdivicinus sp.]|jgi:uncharacterized phage-like protein YoqJ
MERETTVCFTGHRPEKICTPYQEESPYIDAVKHRLQARILAAVDEGYTTFLCGMARGADIWAGEVVASLWEPFRDLELVAVMPFPGQAKGWTEDWALRHRRLLRYCSQVITIEDRYGRDSYLKRNRYLVDHSSRLIGICREEEGGTGYTIRYARSKGLELDLIRLETSAPALRF